MVAQSNPRKIVNMDASNIDQVADWLEEFVHGFNFLRPGLDQNMGRDLCHIIAGRIATRAATESRGADEMRWDAVSSKRKEVKAKAYGWNESDGKPNYATGQMLSHASLFGAPRVSEQVVDMVYGTDTPPARTYSPIDNRTDSQRQADEQVTDREKAAYAHEMGRDFYEVDDEIEAAVIEEAQQHLDVYIGEW